MCLSPVSAGIKKMGRFSKVSNNWGILYECLARRDGLYVVITLLKDVDDVIAFAGWG